MLRTNLQITSMATLLIGLCTISPSQVWATAQNQQSNNLLVQRTLVADKPTKPTPKPTSTPKPFTPTDNGGPTKPTVGSGTR